MKSEEVLRLRALLVDRDAELGAARGRLLELETRAQIRVGRGPQAARAAGAPLEAHRRGSAGRGARAVAEPRFSIVTPVYETPAGVLRAMLRSVRRQRFRDWELCLVDDASSEPHVAAQLEAAARRDPRIRVRRRGPTGASSLRPTTPSRWPAASSSSCSTMTTSFTPTR